MVDGAELAINKSEGDRVSRYTTDRDFNAVLNAAEHWKQTALLGDGSVLSDELLWCMENIDALQIHFVENLDDGDATFLNKLQGQLFPVSGSAKKLAAEMMWAMYLCPSSLTPRHKLEVTQTIWAWSGDVLKPASPWLSVEVLSGVGSGGPGFNQNQWRELTFMVQFARAFKSLPFQERNLLLSDPWTFATWLEKIPGADVRQLRHMLMYMFFPESTERIFGQRDRRAVLRAFTPLTQRDVNKLTPMQIDKALLELRKELEAKHHTDRLDYYEPPLQGQWVRSDLKTQTQDIQVTHVLQALKHIDEHGVPDGAESTGYDLMHEGRRYPPKLALSLAAKYATGEELDRRLFSGGVDAAAFRLLKGLGFSIVSKKPLIFLIRSNPSSAYDDELGKRYHYVNTVPNSKKLALGANVVVDRKDGGKVVLLGFGELGPAVTEVKDGKTHFVADFKTWQAFDPPRPVTEAEKAAIQAHPKFNVQHAVRPLNDETYALLTDQAGAVHALAIEEDLHKSVDQFADALIESGVTFGQSHRQLVAAFLSSLLAKPFAILTGLSGSGKTQIALRLGEWVGGEDHLKVIPVRPDWTGAEALFGYEDGLRPHVNGLAAWAVPEALKFMLKANADSAHPYVLVLDEMNLAHVERYLADLLSGMESKQACIPNLEEQSDGVWRCKDTEEPYVPVPRNLWIVGTVNVDETTYMFSPKVLDRANTFEFRVRSSDLNLDAKKPSSCQTGDEALVRGLLAMGRDDEWHTSNTPEFQEDLAQHLISLHETLSRYGFEFGHRVFYEAVRFSAFASKAGVGDKDDVLDRIVFQKVLPRLHGSRRRLELPLLALAHFCRDLDQVAQDNMLMSIKPEQCGEAAMPRLKLSHDKLCRMLRALRANQFASFTE